MKRLQSLDDPPEQEMDGTNHATRVTRRTWIVGGAALFGSGCAIQPNPTPNRPGTPLPPRDLVAPPKLSVFPSVAAHGSHREIGRALGTQRRADILHVLSNDEAFRRCTQAARGSERQRVARFLEATKALFGNLVEELEGMAEGAGVPFDDLFAWNCRSEIQAALEPCPPPTGAGPAGCSTLGLARDGGMALAHNEDGGEVYLGRMFVARIRPPSGVEFACLVYPGTLPGNGPGLNHHGVVQTTNYIGPCDPSEGVPRYFIGRAVLEATNLDHAVSIVTTRDRAFPWHHNLASIPQGRLLSLETWPGRHHLQTVSGIHLHTNHLTHEQMRGLPERTSYLARSSLPRLQVLRRISEATPPQSVADLLAALRDRSGTPCKVCRHAGDEVPGVTVAAAVFESPNLEMTLIEAPPCRGRSERVTPGMHVG